MNGWSGKSVLKKTGSVVIPDVSVDTDVSREFNLTAGGASRALRIDIKVSGSDSLDTVAATLLHKVNGTYVSTGITNTIRGDDTTTLQMHEATDTALLPFAAAAKIQVSGVGGELTVDDIIVYQEL